MAYPFGSLVFTPVIQALQDTIGFADFRGNRQYISTGNLMTNDKVALILVNYPRRARLKILIIHVDAEQRMQELMLENEKLRAELSGNQTGVAGGESPEGNQ